MILDGMESTVTGNEFSLNSLSEGTHSWAIQTSVFGETTTTPTYFFEICDPTEPLQSVITPFGLFSSFDFHLISFVQNQNHPNSPNLILL